jgi:hypothetical protein
VLSGCRVWHGYAKRVLDKPRRMQAKFAKPHLRVDWEHLLFAATPSSWADISSVVPRWRSAPIDTSTPASDPHKKGTQTSLAPANQPEVPRGLTKIDAIRPGETQSALGTMEAVPICEDRKTKCSLGSIT